MPRLKEQPTPRSRRCIDRGWLDPCFDKRCRGGASGQPVVTTELVTADTLETQAFGNWLTQTGVTQSGRSGMTCPGVGAEWICD
jgi:hypothetical protein